MKTINFTSKQGPYLDLPLQGEWKSLCIDAPITISYVESSEEKIRLVIPDSCAGVLHMRTNDRGRLLISADVTSSPCPSAVLRLEITHKGLKSVVVGGESHFVLSGCTEIMDAAAMMNAVLDLSQAQIRTTHMVVEVGRNAKCELGTLHCDTLKVNLSGNSKLTMKDIHCSDTIRLRAYENGIAYLSGETARFESVQFDECRIYSYALIAKTARAVVCNLSTLSCNAAVLDFYTSPYAFIRNEHPKSQVHPISGISEFHHVRQVSEEDAYQLLLHLKPEEEGASRPLLLHHMVHSLSFTSLWYSAFHRKKDGYFKSMDDGTVEPMSYKLICQEIANTAIQEGLLVVSVSEDDIDWESLPDVKERFLRSSLMSYESLNRDSIP